MCGTVRAGGGGALSVAFLVFTSGVDTLSEGIVQVFLLCLLLLGAFVAFFAVPGRVRVAAPLHAERAVMLGEPGSGRRQQWDYGWCCGGRERRETSFVARQAVANSAMMSGQRGREC